MAAIKNPKTFWTGAALGLSFFAILVLIFSPIFGVDRTKSKPMTGLDFADALFNKLSKSSSYFIPKVRENAAKFQGKSFTVTIAAPAKSDVVNHDQHIDIEELSKFEAGELADKMERVLRKGGAQVVVSQDAKLTISGDLGKLFQAVLDASDLMYHDKGDVVAGNYDFVESGGEGGKQVMSLWWIALSKMMKKFQSEKKLPETNIVADVMKKGIEPAYNFYNIEAQSVSDKALLMISLLVFYVIYTMWWGYSIFYMFDGLGLSMKKAKVKQEV